MHKINKFPSRLIRKRPHSGSSGGITIVDTTDPTITSSDAINLAENSPLAFELTASEAVTWSIVSGADQVLFSITDGNVLSLASQDYEIPVDANSDNVYVVGVRATDLSSNTSDQTISVTITDVIEGVPNTATDDDYMEWVAAA